MNNRQDARLERVLATLALVVISLISLGSRISLLELSFVTHKASASGQTTPRGYAIVDALRT